jgi:chemotaxis protein methyltransferase CheR
VARRNAVATPNPTALCEERLDAQLFQKFCDIAYSKAGIKLRDGKEALVAARVAKRLRALGLSSPAEYLRLLEQDASGTEVISFLDTIATNFTSFFREPSHFDRLREYLEHCVRHGRKRIRIWCTACSSGEEPYTVAMTAAEVLDASIDWRILATDISTKILAQAREGTYAAASLKAVPPGMRAKYFVAIPADRRRQLNWQVTSELRNRIAFKRLNLATPPYPMSGPLDVVFCRNVMIYFDDPVRRGLISEIERLISNDGMVCVGHSETLSGFASRLVAVEPSVYQVPGTAFPLACTKGSKRTQG